MIDPKSWAYAPAASLRGAFGLLYALLGAYISMGVAYLLQATLPYHPSPSRSAFSRASSPHSSSFCALLATWAASPSGHPTVASAKNCRMALVALGSPKSLPSG
ncbi:hypothetical protein VTN77DRAFT_4663 [Rasamsonia byssochlamydoides]|uniref:uncharacterized protein n=1 Tax=Rasamsonia byssochlamydoides TaxID=89139 RepID=UPI003742C8F1